MSIGRGYSSSPLLPGVSSPVFGCGGCGSIPIRDHCVSLYGNVSEWAHSSPTRLPWCPHTATSTQRITALIRSGGWTLLLLRKREKEENPDLQAFLDQHHLRDRLNPRESFFGGRTNALKLFHEGDAKYVDFTSLYPWVNKYCVYPVGHPTIITESFRDVEDYFGIIQCRVIPPRNLYLPVLPYRCRKKLMFPLCRTCALLQLQTPCTHTDDERALVGTWVTEEVKLAKKKGYRVTHIYEVYHFQASSTSLFQIIH
ncbi:uncharacterized protein LOC118187172 [Stegodyphus dumicola]|uniref:uncharacterized protein LOC118187172 n=1 Tax=Stegodyphus dumicola TaxID=202533 RepID=UPI0015A7B22C|nr:uncharacterized protein LOC118187172 [Stegodyphus dumicola]